MSKIYAFDDVLRSIFLYLDINTLNNVYMSSKTTINICDYNFWKEKFEKDYILSQFKLKISKSKYFSLGREFELIGMFQKVEEYVTKFRNIKLHTDISHKMVKDALNYCGYCGIHFENFNCDDLRWLWCEKIINKKLNDSVCITLYIKKDTFIISLDYNVENMDEDELYVTKEEFVLILTKLLYYNPGITISLGLLYLNWDKIIRRYNRKQPLYEN